MANPQCEDGYTKIANEIMDALIKTNLSGREFRMALLVIRKTYGYGKKEDSISLSQMSKQTGFIKTNSSQIIRSLENRKVVTVTENSNGIGKKYKFNKNFEEWLTVTENSNRYRKRDKKGLLNSVTTKERSITKENINTIRPELEGKITKKFTHDTDAYKLSEILFNLILENNPHSRLHTCIDGNKELTLQRWSTDFDLLIRKDRQSPLIIEDIIRFCTADAFWRSNILSGAKLREKWDTLVARKESTSRGNVPLTGKPGRDYKSYDAAGRELKYL